MPHVAIGFAAAALPTILAGAGAALVGTAGVTVSSVLVSAALTGALGGLQAAITGQQKVETPRAQISVRQPLPNGQRVYGRCRVGGSLAFYGPGETSASEDDLLMVVVFACHRVNRIVALYDGDKKFWDVANVVGGDDSTGIDPLWADDVETVNISLGTDDQAVFPNIRGPLPTTLAGATGTNFRLRGCAAAYVRLRNFTKKWKGREPTLWAEVEGALTLDPRTGQTVYSENPALHIADMLTATRGGGGLPSAFVDQASIISAANICDEQVAKKGGGTEARYRHAGVYDSGTPTIDHLAVMLASCVGSIDNEWTGLRLRVGSYTAPVETLGPDDFLEPLSITPAINGEDWVDGVRGSWADPAAGYQPADLPVVLFADYDPGKGAERLAIVDLPTVTSPTRAQRVAVLTARQQRRARQITTVAPPRWLHLRAGGVVNVAEPALGLLAPYEVERVGFAGESGGAVALTLRETGPEWWAYTAADASDAIASRPSTLRPGRSVAPPGSVTVERRRRLAADGTVELRIEVSWTKSSGPYLMGYRVYWTFTDENGKTKTLTHVTTDLEHEILGVPVGAAATVTVAAVNWRGTESAKVGPAPVTPIADATAPQRPSIGVFSNRFGAVRIRVAPETGVWPADLDKFRVYVGNASTGFAAVYLDDFTGSAYTARGLPLGETQRFWVDAVDRSGNASPLSAFVDATPWRIDTDEMNDGAVRTAKITQGDVTELGTYVNLSPQTFVQQAAWRSLGFVLVDRTFGGSVALFCALKVRLTGSPTAPVKLRLRESFGGVDQVVQDFPKTFSTALIEMLSGELSFFGVDQAAAGLGVTRFDLEVDMTSLTTAYEFDDVTVAALAAKR